MTAGVAPGAASALLALALMIGWPAPGPLRLRTLGTSDPPTEQAGQSAPLRPAWMAVGAVAAGALGWAAAGPVAAVVMAGTAAGAAAYVARRAAGRAERDGEVELAGRWELLAVCLRAGLPVAAAVSATAEPLSGAAGARLRRVAGLHSAPILRRRGGPRPTYRHSQRSPGPPPGRPAREQRSPTWRRRKASASAPRSPTPHMHAPNVRRS